MEQYEIWWVSQYLNKFLAAEITTTLPGIPVEIPLGAAEGLQKRCVANCDNLRTIGRSWLVKRLGALALARHSEAKRAFGYALGWEELIEVL